MANPPFVRNCRTLPPSVAGTVGHRGTTRTVGERGLLRLWEDDFSIAEATPTGHDIAMEADTLRIEVEKADRATDVRQECKRLTTAQWCERHDVPLSFVRVTLNTEQWHGSARAGRLQSVRRISGEEPATA